MDSEFVVDWLAGWLFVVGSYNTLFPRVCYALQEVYQQTHPVLFSNSALYAVVFSHRVGVSFAELSRPLTSITVRFPNVRILVIGTCIDEASPGSAIPLHAWKERYPQVWQHYGSEHVFGGVSGVPFVIGRYLLPSACFARASLAVQIVNDHVLSVSSVTGEGMAQLQARIAQEAQALPRVCTIVPAEYLKFESDMLEYGRELRSRGELPVVSRRSVLRSAKDPEAVQRAAKFLLQGGSLLAVPDGEFLILDPAWVAETLAHVISVDPARRSLLPESLVAHGILHHDDATLAKVWPDTEYSASLRADLLPLLHRIELAYQLHHVTGFSDASLVPSMLPHSVGWGGVTPDELLGSLGPATREVGATYHLQSIPPDFWALLLARCSALSMPQTCTSSSVVVSFGRQRALVTMDVGRAVIKLCCRGPDPQELRGRLHATLCSLVDERFPNLLPVGGMYPVCTQCGHDNPLVPNRVREMVKVGETTMKCGYCPAESIDVHDLIERPEVVLARMLQTPSSADVKDKMSLLAWAVDNALGVSMSASPRLYLPEPLAEKENWVPVCEHSDRWHVVRDNSMLTLLRDGSTAPDAVMPLLLLVARTLKACGQDVPEDSIAFLEERVKAVSHNESESQTLVPVPTDQRKLWGQFVFGEEDAAVAPLQSQGRDSASGPLQSSTLATSGSQWLCLQHRHVTGEPRAVDGDGAAAASGSWPTRN
jgi:hypothetical protein